MSQSQRAHASSSETLWQHAESADEHSGIRRIEAIIADARRTWEEENLRDEAAEVAMFEWQMFLTDLAPAPQNDAVAAPAVPASTGAIRHDHDDEELFAPPAAEVQAWIERRPRRASIRAAGRLLIAGAFAGMLGIAATPAGSDAIASWLTMGHRDQARTQVAQMTHRLGAWGR